MRLACPWTPSPRIAAPPREHFAGGSARWWPRWPKNGWAVGLALAAKRPTNKSMTKATVAKEQDPCYTVVQSLIESGGTEDIQCFSTFCRGMGLALHDVLSRCPFLEQKDDSVTVANVDDLAAFCLEHWMLETEQLVVHMGQAGEQLQKEIEMLDKSLKGTRTSKLRSFLQKYPGRFRIDSKSPNVFMLVQQQRPQRARQQQQVNQEMDPYYAVVENLIKEGGTVDFDGFVSLCGSHQLTSHDVLSRFDFLEEKDDGWPIVTVGNVDDLAAYCLEHWMKGAGAECIFLSVASPALHTILKPLSPELSDQRTQKISKLVRKYPQFCVIGSTGVMSLREPWAVPEFPVSESEAESNEAAEVDAENTEGSEPSVAILRDSATRYMDLRLKGLKIKRKDSKITNDRVTVAQSFETCISQHGILRAEVVLAEIDNFCKLRGISEVELLRSADIGPILAGYVKTLVFIETVIRVTLASHPVVTLHELEQYILQHRMFAGKSRFEDALVGKLQFHPLVQDAFGLTHLGSLEGLLEFPRISSADVIRSLFSAPVLSCFAASKRFSDLRARSMTASLAQLAASNGFSDFRQMGIAVQDGSFLGEMVPLLNRQRCTTEIQLWRHGAQYVAQALAEWTSLACAPQHQVFLEELARLSAPQKQEEFVQSILRERPSWQQKTLPSASGYVKLLFGELLGVTQKLLAESGSAEDSAGDAVDLVNTDERDALVGTDEADAQLSMSQPTGDQVLAQLCQQLRLQSNTSDMLEVIGRTGLRWSNAVFASWLQEHSSSIAAAMGSIGPSGQALELENGARELAGRMVAAAPGTSTQLLLRALGVHFQGMLKEAELGSIVEEAQEASATAEGPPAGVVLNLAQAVAAWSQDGSESDCVTGSRALEQAAQALLSAPLLMDLTEALPQWSRDFRGLGDLVSFVRSADFQAIAQRKGAEGCLVEVRHGSFVRVPRRSECQLDSLNSAVNSENAREAAAIVFARLVREGKTYMEMMRESVSVGYKDFKESENFLLRAVAALPLQAPREAIDVLSAGYLRLERPRLNMAAAARGGSLRHRLALKRLACYFNFPEWEEIAEVEAGKAEVAREVAKAFLQKETEKEREALETVEADVALEESRASRVQLESNEEVCWRIAALKKVDYNCVDLEKRVWIQEPEDEGVRALQSTVQGAVKRLSEDLYSGEAHFLLELLQNVDDCTYAQSATPTLKLRYETRRDKFAEITNFKAAATVEGLLVVEHNETGFKTRNVLAICDIDKSTKLAREKRFIGAKGIGFKSVFLVTATPVIQSGIFNFHFDSDALNGLGSLLPFPLPANLTASSGTRLVLPLDASSGPLKKRGLRAEDVGRRALLDVKPTLLLFLRKVQQIQVSRNGQEERLMKKKTHPKSASTEEVELFTIGSSQLVERWLLHTRVLTLRGQDGDVASELKLAFRLDQCGPLPAQEAHAWLPLRSYGLRFIVQADWQVPSSREAIQDNVFNQQVRDQVPNAFADAARVLADEAEMLSLQEASSRLAPLYHAMPIHGDAIDFFQGMDAAILEAMQEVRCVLVQAENMNGDTETDGAEEEGKDARESQFQLVVPQQAVRADFPTGVPARSTSSLVRLLAEAGRFVETGGMPARAADALRVPVVDAEVALECLKTLAQRPSTSDEEHVELLRLLLLTIASTRPALGEKVRKLAVLPVEEGRLVSLEEEDLKGCKVYDIPASMAGVEKMLGQGYRLDPRLSGLAEPEVMDFLVLLGVERVEGLAFMEKELLPVLTRPEEPDPERLLLATRTLRSLLSYCEQPLQEVILEKLGEWWVLDSKDAVRKVGKAEALHLTVLPPELEGKLDWMIPSPRYKDEDWEDFWLLLGAVPLFRVTRTEAGDYESEDLAKLLQCAKTPEIARSLVQLLVPFGDYYAPYLWKAEDSATAPAPSSVGRLLCESAWLPTQQKTIVSMNLACLDGPERFRFDECVKELADAWPLGIAKASTRTLVSILRSLREKPSGLSCPQMASLYMMLEDPGVNDATLFANVFPDCDLDAFLRDEPWVFIPDHPKPHGGFEQWYRRTSQDTRSGAFYKVSQLVYKDAAECLDGFSANASDELIDLMRQTLDKRVVANYYFSAKTLWPASWQESEKSKTDNRSDFHTLAKMDIQERLELEDYIQVLKAIDELVGSRPASQLSRVPRFVGQILAVVARLLQAELDRVDGDPVAEKRVVAKFRDPLLEARFLQAADGTWQSLKTLQCVPREWRKTPDWFKEALQLVACPKGSERAVKSIRDLLRLCELQGEYKLLKCAVVTVREDDADAVAVRQQLCAAARDVRAASSMLQELAAEVEKVLADVSVVACAGVSIFQALALEEATPRAAAAGELQLLQLSGQSPSLEGLAPAAFTKSLGESTGSFVGYSCGRLSLAVQRKDFEVESLANSVLGAALRQMSVEKQAKFLTNQAFTPDGLAARNVLMVALQEARCATQSGGEASKVTGVSRATDRDSADVSDATPEATGAVSPGVQRILDFWNEPMDVNDEERLTSLSLDLGMEVSEVSVEELLQNAEQALNYKKARRAKPSTRPDVSTARSSSSASALGSQKGAERQHANALAEFEVLGPYVPYDAAKEAFDGEQGQTSKRISTGRTPSGASAASEYETRDKDKTPSLEKGVKRAVLQPSPSQSQKSRSQPQTFSMPFIYEPATIAQTQSFVDLTPERPALELESARAGASEARSGMSATVGRFGEQLAQRALTQLGYQVLWLNDGLERGLPFDLMVRSNGSFSFLTEGGRVSQEKIDQLFEQALRGESPTDISFVEVKSTSFAAASYEMSYNQLGAMQILGSRFWLARCSDALRDPKLRLWRDMSKALRQREIRLQLQP
ncbi:unnamed protein product [Effrenium voratum]|uniref:Sacsin/Nov domain-containing protein n=1 Tax=Effrenium voratum TaxID=2562239 RepID=A0AA36MPD7_9DINO|nr:unnamed protein product [Effrenium voratum]CAJ1437728.1 unnamed protein product [Effrenium voratum]